MSQECLKPLSSIPPVVFSRPSSPRWTVIEKTAIKSILEKPGVESVGSASLKLLVDVLHIAGCPRLSNGESVKYLL